MQLKNYIARYIDISDSEYQTFLSHLSSKSFTPGEKILDYGQRCQYRYYIQRGCVRMYGFTEKGKEQIYHFGKDNWWITNYESLLNNSPSKLVIEAIEPTTIYFLSTTDFEKLCEVLPKTERLFRIIMERSYLASEKRLEYLFNLTSEEQFKHFISTNSAFVQRVPQYMLASYLGVTPEFISKVRSKMKSADHS